jgi:hypothetical protein
MRRDARDDLLDDGGVVCRQHDGHVVEPGGEHAKLPQRAFFAHATIDAPVDGRAIAHQRVQLRAQQNGRQLAHVCVGELFVQRCDCFVGGCRRVPAADGDGGGVVRVDRGRRERALSLQAACALHCHGGGAARTSDGRALFRLQRKVEDVFTIPRLVWAQPTRVFIIFTSTHNINTPPTQLINTHLYFVIFEWFLILNGCEQAVGKPPTMRSTLLYLCLAAFAIYLHARGATETRAWHARIAGECITIARQTALPPVCGRRRRPYSKKTCNANGLPLIDLSVTYHSFFNAMRCSLHRH